MTPCTGTRGKQRCRPKTRDKAQPTAASPLALLALQSLSALQRAGCPSVPWPLAILCGAALRQGRLGPEILSDVMQSWEGSSSHRCNFLLPNVSAAGVAMTQNDNGRAYWTLVLGAE